MKNSLSLKHLLSVAGTFGILQGFPTELRKARILECHHVFNLRAGNKSYKTGFFASLYINEGLVMIFTCSSTCNVITKLSFPNTRTLKTSFSN